MASKKIKIEIEPEQPYKEVRRNEKNKYDDCPVFRRKKFDPNKISAEMLRDHCRKNELYMIPRFNTVLYLHFMVGQQNIFFFWKFFFTFKSNIFREYLK